MRNVAYLSPSGLSSWLKDRDEYYLKYLAESRPDRIPQTQAMAAGSAFDARVKSHLHEAVIGKDPAYEFGSLFETQVEPHQRDWARKHCEYIFAQYRLSGALADLEAVLNAASEPPRFEFELQGGVEGVPFLGRPDLAYVTADGTPVVRDFKVNGYVSRHAPSPCPGYLNLRAPGTSRGKHKDAKPAVYRGVKIDSAQVMERANPDWARQLSVYAWLMGRGICEDFVVGIDQLVCNANRPGPFPSIRVAEHCTLISPQFQAATIRLAQEVWEIIHSDWIFRDMPREDSASKCEALDAVAAALSDGSSDEDEWLRSFYRS